MKHEVELLELCDNDIDLFLDIRSIFEKQYHGNKTETEKRIMSVFIDRYPEVLDCEFDDQWKNFRLEYKSKYPEWFV